MKGFGIHTDVSLEEPPVAGRQQHGLGTDGQERARNIYGRPR